MLRSEMFLVLDDYHLITSRQVQDALIFLIEHLPGNLHLVIASRADPSLPLARYRACGELAELHLADLRFHPDEAADFLHNTAHLDLCEEDSAALTARTEGWIAGLQMAALSVQDQAEPSRFIRAFTGSNRYVMDYLVEEVFQRRPPEVQEFLLQTSILEKMCGLLCEAVVDGLREGEGQAMLEQLERANLFILPLDDRRAWYRYHRLFADLLSRQIALHLPGRSAELHRRACAWYRAHDLPGDAIAHALKGEDFQKAGDLIEAAAEQALLYSQNITLSNWIDALPAEQLHSRPRLRLYHAWVSLYRGKPLNEIETYLQQIDASALPGHLAALNAYLTALKGSFYQAFNLAQDALTHLPSNDCFLRSMATWILGLQVVIAGKREQAMIRLKQVIQNSQRVGNVMVTVFTLCNLGDQIISQGDLPLAEETYQRALALAVDEQGSPLPISGLALTRLGEILRERNELAQAEAVITEGLQRLRPWNELATIYGSLSLALVQQARGDTASADATIANAGQLAVRYDITQVDDRMVQLIQMRLRLLQGDRERSIRTPTGCCQPP